MAQERHDHHADPDQPGNEPPAETDGDGDGGRIKDDECDLFDLFLMGQSGDD